MVILRTTRFPGQCATLVVQECADRRRVLIEMQDHGGDGDEYRRNILLHAAQWRHLTSLPYLDRRGADALDHPPAGTYESTEFISRDRTLRIVEMPEHDVVRVEMFKEGGDDSELAWLSVDLTAEQWRYLAALDYIDATKRATAGHIAKRAAAEPRSWLH